MPTLFCCILNCETESISSKKRKIFYRLPQNAERKQLWLTQIGDRLKYGTISPNSRICNAHFATGKPNLDSSHIDYVPTIFPWSTKEEMSKSHQAVENYEMKIKELEQKILAKAFLTASNESKTSSEIEVSKIVEPDEYSKLNIEPDLEQRNKLPKINTQSELNLSQNLSNISHSSVPMANRSSSVDVTLNSNLLNYLINSLTHVNVPNSNTINNSTVNTMPLSVNIAMPSCPLNLSQSYNKFDDQSFNESNNSTISSIQLDSKMNPDFFKPVNQNGQMFSFQIQNVISLNQNQAAAPASSADETNSRSCTCTKSSCLKLYCECFATGNICSSGCTCINCRNNNRYKEERAKIVSSYLERDPWVFNSKIDSQEVGKKHSKGCNCLKSSCLKNYCECFENKVFCSNLCRCRLCCNNEEHAIQNNRKEEVKIYPASHTSDSLSVLSENSPRDPGRKRKPSTVKSNEIYEDVSSNESSEELSIKRQQMDPEMVPGTDQDRQSGGGRSITSMDIPPVLPNEEDFTEEELAMMLKFREQRSVKVESVSPPPPLPRMQGAPLALLNGTHFPHQQQQQPITSSPMLNIPTQIDPNLLLSLSKSLAVANLGVSLVNSTSNCLPPGPPLLPQQDLGKLTGNDLINLLVSQQLMVPRPAPVTQNIGHVIPVNLSQPPPQHQTVPVPPSSMLTSPRPSHVVTVTQHSPSSVAQSSTACSLVSNGCPIKSKLSTEDYVRRHIEAAERAVRADNMRRDCIGPKKAIMKQKVKIEPNVSPQKTRLSGQDECTTTTPGGLLTNGYGSETPLVKNLHGNHTPSTCGPAGPLDIKDSIVTTVPSDRKWKNRYKTLRMSLHNMRTELRSIKVHMRADQSKIRRLESALLHMSSELHN